jgi:hypothetical protein
MSREVAADHLVDLGAVFMKLLLLTVLCPALFGGCVTAPPAPPNRTMPDPSDPAAPQASTRPLRPNLVATTKVYLDPAIGQEAQKMEHGNMQGMEGMQGMDHSQMKGMEGMDHSKMPGMTSQPQNKEALEKEMKQTSGEMKKTSDAMKQKSDEMKPAAVIYTCTMHPEVESDKPGNCPKCGMKLVPKSAGR